MSVGGISSSGPIETPEPAQEEAPAAPAPASAAASGGRMDLLARLGPAAPAKTQGPAAPGSAAEPKTLDDLAGLKPSQLGALYRRGTTPAFGTFRGVYSGRYLAPLAEIPGTEELRRALFASHLVPWRGKSFTPMTATTGVGSNLFELGGVEKDAMSFNTSVGRSRAGNFDAIRIDYDRPGNPWPLSTLRDELRQVGPGLYLGQAYVHLANKDVLVGYFALKQAKEEP